MKTSTHQKQRPSFLFGLTSYPQIYFKPKVLSFTFLFVLSGVSTGVPSAVWAEETPQKGIGPARFDILKQDTTNSKPLDTTSASPVFQNYFDKSVNTNAPNETGNTQSGQGKVPQANLEQSSTSESLATKSPETRRSVFSPDSA